MYWVKRWKKVKDCEKKKILLMHLLIYFKDNKYKHNECSFLF